VIARESGKEGGWMLKGLCNAGGGKFYSRALTLCLWRCRFSPVDERCCFPEARQIDGVVERKSYRYRGGERRLIASPYTFQRFDEILA